MTDLELLAPAGNVDIGIAAIDCGADAVYMAGPKFGARQAAGNPMSDVAGLCGYAHRFGARIFLTLNTILYDNELIEAERLLKEAKSAGVDAVIAQDLAVSRLTDLPVHASTQCAIRTPEKARFYESLGFSRLVLEREMSLEGIKAIRRAVSCDLEFFVHGALCVCYSGQCYMSESITGRSANRGECMQACRSLYDLVDESGKVLAKDKALLSLKDYNLRGRIEDLADSGICSLKIEGRLKNISYVRNVTRDYSIALDNLAARWPDKYRRASFGRVSGGFSPDLDKTFNRGYTKLFLDGTRGKWSSMDTPKSMGEEIGTVLSFGQTPERCFRPSGGDASKAQGRNLTITVKFNDSSEILRNGDGFAFVSKDRNEIIGFRGDVCQGNTINCKSVSGLFIGARLFRNLDSAFEKELDNNLPVRLIPVEVSVIVSDQNDEKRLTVKAVSQDGRTVVIERNAGSVAAENLARMKAMFASQISKSSGQYSFNLKSLSVKTLDSALPFLPAVTLNGIRRSLAEKLDEMPCNAIPMPSSIISEKSETPFADVNDGTTPFAEYDPATRGSLTYKANVANHLAREIYESRGAENIEDAFEISHRKEAELMRTKHCVRFELGICPVHQKAGEPSSSKLFLLNNGKRYALGFDCRRCEMTVSEES